MNEQTPDRPDPADPGPTAIPESFTALEDRLGNYRLLQKIGEGGMGDVYLAEQRQPIRRKVALKIIKRGMDTQEVVRRFEAERQALAMMDHPCIAKMFEAGATERGRPYFAMEHVQGVPITQHCDTHRLTNRERLTLFQQICEGVQHAHQKAIIHRDLKPSNILVTIQDGKTVPKIIDFGVAKATAQRLTERTIYTELGQLIGTPEYMSPEQAEMTGQDVDTRTDVYSLGVLLYELMVGKLPFEPQELRRAGFDEIRRKIREVDPPRPSTRITRMGKSSDILARNRRTTVAKLSSQLRGDLDWITMKALEKDRTRRYGSPSELAADIDRYLHNQPILAGSPGTIYRLGKFIKRHRFGVSATAIFFALLVSFAIMMTLQANRVARQRDRALAAEQRALTEAETAAEVSEFLVDLFEVSDPSEARGNSVTAREILDRGAVRIEETLVDQPEVQARLMHTMGNVYLNLGLFDSALELAEEVYRIRQSLYTGDHSEIAQSLLLLSEVHIERGEFDRAEGLNREALAMNQRLFGAEHPKTADCLQTLAINLKHQNRLEESEKAYREVLTIRHSQIPPDSVATASTLTSLGELLRLKDQLDESEALHRGALNLIRESEGDYHPVVRSTLNNLALVFEARESYAEAEELLREVVQIDTKVFGTRSPHTATSLSNLAGLLNKTGKLDEAEELHRQALAINREILAADHPDLATSLNNLSTVLMAKGELDEAADLLTEALEIIRKAMGDEHPRVGITLYNLGLVYNKKGDYTAARRRFQDAEQRMAQSLPGDHWRLGNLRSMIGICLAHEGRFAEGEPLVIGGYQTVQAARGGGDRRTLAALERVVQFYELANRPTEAGNYRAKLKKSTPDE